MGGGWIDFLCDDSSSQAGTNPPPPPFHHPHPSVRSLHPCASVALGRWPLVVSCSWRVRSTAPLHLSFPSNCREIIGADHFSDKSIIFGTTVTLGNLMTVFFLALSFFSSSVMSLQCSIQATPIRSVYLVSDSSEKGFRFLLFIISILRFTEYYWDWNVSVWELMIPNLRNTSFFGGGNFNFFMFLLQWFNVNACMGWPYYHFKPMKVLRNPWIELYAASLKSARTITRNTFSCVHLAGGENIPILGVPGDIRVYAGAFEAPVRVLAVVKGHAVNTQHVGLQVAFLRGAVGTVAALEWLLTSMTWERNRPHYHPVQCQ